LPVASITVTHRMTSDPAQAKGVRRTDSTTQWTHFRMSTLRLRKAAGIIAAPRLLVDGLYGS
jgi:hypothetical protein